MSWYTHHDTRKRSGAARPIAEPASWLRRVQRAILRGVLDRAEPSPYAHGFVKGRDVYSFAAPHAGKRTVIRLDVADFFPSVSLAQVGAVFWSLVPSPRLAHLFALYCTDPRTGALPQGAPTSPAIANLAAAELDSRIAEVARRFSLVYTRYADDLALSGDLSRPQALQVIRAASRAARASGFRLNDAKTRIMPRGSRQLLAGLVLNEGAPRPPRELRRRARAAEHNHDTSPGARGLVAYAKGRP